MAVTINSLERTARYVLGAMAIAGVIVLVAIKLEWITAIQPYKKESWYLVAGNASFVITSEFGNEADCRREEKASAICRSGLSLMEEAQQATQIR